MDPATTTTRALDVARLEDLSHLTHLHPGQSKPARAFADRERGWMVQVYANSTPGCIGTPWEGTLRVGVNHTSAATLDDFFKREFGIPITWDELQTIKDHFWPDQIAIEVFPPHDKIVDSANMRWLWVLPHGSALPFNLQALSLSRLEG